MVSCTFLSLVKMQIPKDNVGFHYFYCLMSYSLSIFCDGSVLYRGR